MPEAHKSISPCPKNRSRAARHRSRRTLPVVLAPTRHVPLDEIHERQAVTALEELLAGLRESRAVGESPR